VALQSTKATRVIILIILIFPFIFIKLRRAFIVPATPSEAVRVYEDCSAVQRLNMANNQGHFIDHCRSIHDKYDTSDISLKGSKYGGE
jgi:hypothetical protein